MVHYSNLIYYMKLKIQKFNQILLNVKLISSSKPYIELFINY